MTELHLPPLKVEASSWHTLAAIVATVLELTGVTEEQMRGRGRGKTEVLARAMIAWMARCYTTCSYPEIAGVMRGAMHRHTSVIAAQRLMERLLEDAEARINLGGTLMTYRELMNHACGVLREKLSRRELR